MPYSGTSDPSLPANVKRLSATRKRQWLAAYNSGKGRGMADGDAIKLANGVIKKQMGHSMSQGKNDFELEELAAMIDVDSHAMDDPILIEVGQECGYGGGYYEDWAPKIPQDEANYQVLGGTTDRACANCRWFLQHRQECQVVSGTIYHTGVSDRYEALPTYDPSPMEVTLVDSNGDTIDFQDLFDQLTAGGMSLEAGWHATWTAKYIDALPDSAFAFIDPGGKKDADGKTTPRSLRHFPYKDDAGKLDEAHVRNALARVPQSHVSAVGKHAALVKLHAAARSLGIKLTAEEPTASAASNENGVMRVARNAYESILGFLGLEELAQPASWTDMPQAEIEVPSGTALSLHEGVEGETGPLATPPGRLRYWAVASNNFYDNKGLEFPAAAQHEYVDWVWSDPEKNMPELQGWHTPGTRLGQADWVDFDGHFLHSTGLIDVGREEIARDLASDPEMAMSHGYVVVWDRHSRAKVFRSYEQSVLPRQSAGNSFTSFGLEEDNVAFSEPRKAFLRERFGLSDDEINARETRWEQFGGLLEKLGIGFHELELYVASVHADDPPSGDGDGEGQQAQGQQPQGQAPAGQPVADATAAPAAQAGQQPQGAPVAAAAAQPAAAAQASNEGGQLATDTMTPETLRAMLESVVQAQVAPLAQAVHGLQEHQGRVEQLLPNARPAQPAGYDATKGANGVPGLVGTPNGGVSLGQQGRDGAPLEPLPPNVLQAIAAGAAEGGGSLESPIAWLEKRFEAQHPILNGKPTESRG